MSRQPHRISLSVGIDPDKYNMNEFTTHNIRIDSVCPFTFRIRNSVSDLHTIVRKTGRKPEKPQRFRGVTVSAVEFLICGQ